ncbi:MAG TPA: aroma-sacti cluster domain-containing protein [Solirubrobacteraceae bacterium]
MATERDNEQRLRDAGVILTTESLEAPFQAVVEGLTPHEVDVMIAVKRRLDEADRTFGWDPESGEPRPSSARIPP